MVWIKRRELLRRSAAISLLAPLDSPLIASARGTMSQASIPFRRNRPSDRSWPSASSWQELNEAVGGRLIKVQWPISACEVSPDGSACAELFRALKNPYYIGDQVSLTQTAGWVDAWTCAPSVYAVAANQTEDVVAAVNFAREHRLRLVIKGGGHSYQGTSNCRDSLLIWMRAMDAVTLHDAFVARDCAGIQPSQPAVSIGAGALWMHVYDAVTTKGGRYVQGGGCATVGVAGLIQSGGFGSFSKNYGMAAAALLEAEVVTTNGVVRIANPCTNPELFWGIKGGGGGSLGVLTRVTLRTRELPDFFGGVFATVNAKSDNAFRRLIRQFIGFYNDKLFNRYWGESVRFSPSNGLTIAMVFQGMDRQQAAGAWQPFFEWVAGMPEDYTVPSPPAIVDIPARNFWNPEYLRKIPGLVISDDRPGAATGNVFWASTLAEAGQFLHGYESIWLPALLLQGNKQERLTEALFAGSRHWPIALHFNKGLAGAPPERSSSCGGHRDESRGAGCFRPRDQRRCRAAGVSWRARPRARCSKRTRAYGGNRQGYERAASHRRFSVLRVGEQLFRTRLAAIVLGRKLRPIAGGEESIRSRRTLVRASRRGKRSLESRRLHKAGLK